MAIGIDLSNYRELSNQANRDLSAGSASRLSLSLIAALPWAPSAGCPLMLLGSSYVPVSHMHRQRTVRAITRASGVREPDIRDGIPLACCRAAAIRWRVSIKKMKPSFALTLAWFGRYEK